MQGKAESGEKAQCTWEYMSILSRFPTQHGAARDFFNSLLALFCLFGAGQAQGHCGIHAQTP
jgi:hypothetical protein